MLWVSKLRSLFPLSLHILIIQISNGAKAEPIPPWTLGEPDMMPSLLLDSKSQLKGPLDQDVQLNFQQLSDCKLGSSKPFTLWLCILPIYGTSGTKSIATLWHLDAFVRRRKQQLFHEVKQVNRPEELKQMALI